MAHVIAPHRLDPDRSAVFLVDLQEKLCPAIPEIDEVINRSIVLTKACDELGIPRSATVQYPEGLGDLTEQLNDHYPKPHAKLDFSAAVCREPIEQWAAQGRDQILLIGIETHICITQTALDLCAEGKNPIVVIDLVASRNKQDHLAGIERLRNLGIQIVSLESVLFEWLGSSRHPRFRVISGLVKAMNRSSTGKEENGNQANTMNPTSPSE